VQDALPIVVVAVVILAALVAFAMMLASRGTYEQIGRSGMTFDREAAQSANDPFRDEEIRQLLDATNAARAARGRSPLTLESFEGPPATGRRAADQQSAAGDDGLRAEVRAFVESRNARRVARGQPPLDVEAEVERRMSGQDG
jgi:hypothetical protein